MNVPKVYYGQYCTLLSQSDFRYFVVLPRSLSGFFGYFKGRYFRGQKLSRVKNLWNKLLRFAVFGTNFVEKTFANRGKSLFSREKTFANEQKK